MQNGAFIGAGEGLAAASVKFGNLTLAQTSLYVGREALALYDIEYDQTRNGRGMSVINAGSSSLHWGINSYANTPSLTDLPEEIASGYNVAFGEELKTKAYFLQVNQEKFETTSRQYLSFRNQTEAVGRKIRVRKLFGGEREIIRWQYRQPYRHRYVHG